MKIIARFLLGLFLLVSSALWADTLYVDCQLTTDCITYNPATRLCDGGTYKGYKNLQAALDNVQIGDVILGREGRYHPEGPTFNYLIPASKNGTSWNEGEYFTLKSADGEWMILDGQNNVQFAVIGDGTAKSYWKFERLEITGGRTPSTARGFFAKGGPFIFRYCYIHDNLSPQANNIPAGLSGKNWSNSLVEYCYFKNNGSIEDTWINASHIIIYSDYNELGNAKNGFIDLGTGKHAMKNEWRYNLFEGASNGIWITKGDQFFTGRNTGYSEVANTYGDKIHHNIFMDMASWAIGLNQDFAQVYNNIMYNCGSAVVAGYATTFPGPYKPVIYNNSYIKTKRGAIHKHTLYNKEVVLPNPNYYAFHYNDFTDSVPTFLGNSERFEEFTAFTLNDKGAIAGATQDSFIINHCYSHRPASHSFDTDGSRMIYMGESRYTIDQFKTLRPGVKLWMNADNPQDNLYKGTTGADRYKTRGGHVLNGDTTIANGGIGGSHPYLQGVMIPSYIGATDPNDDSWVDTVLNLTRLSVMTGMNMVLDNDQSSVKLFPNPVSTTLTISGGSSLCDKGKIELYTLKGTKIHQTSQDVFFPHQVDVSGYEPGFYLLKVIMDGKCFTQKVVKE